MEYPLGKRRVGMGRSIRPRRLVGLSLLVVLVSLLGGVAAATGSTKRVHATQLPTTTYGPLTPTYVGPAATGCASGCSLMTGPFDTPSTAGMSRRAAGRRIGTAASGFHRMVTPFARVRASGGVFGVGAQGPPMIPNVSCQPLGNGCDLLSASSGGATGVKGLNAVDSASMPTNPLGDIEPPDQGLCAGNGYVVETNNIGEIMVFNTALGRQSGTIPLDTVMGLTSRAWSSGGDPSCEYDPSNGGHWFITEMASADPESAGGAFNGCFAGATNTCYEAIAVTQGSSPFGPYHVYFLNANYNPSEPGNGSLLNDFGKIGLTRDAFLLFYDEFPLKGGGMGNGLFNGAQEFAFDKNQLERGRPVTLKNGTPNPNFNVAIENMGTLPTPDGTCAGSAGVDCWVAVIPGQPADSSQWDNSYGGSGFMVSGLDFISFAAQQQSSGDNRIASWYWRELSALNTSGCAKCSKIKFGGDLFTGTIPYDDPENNLGVGNLGAQKVGPTPLGDVCANAGQAASQPCPENGLNTNGDFMTQVSQAQGKLWAPMTTEVNQQFANGSEIHQGVDYWVLDTNSYDTTGQFVIDNQGIVSAAHQDLEMPAMAAQGTGGSGKAIMLFTASGNGGPTAPPGAGLYPSTAYGRLTATSDGLTGSTINIADLGRSPQDGFTEYQGYPGGTRPRWGDYSEGIYLPDGSGRLYFANEYIQYPNCMGSAFNYNMIGTCGGTRDGFANWGTSVNYVVP